jgi:hypothetical protein
MKLVIFLTVVVPLSGIAYHLWATRRERQVFSAGLEIQATI